MQKPKVQLKLNSVPNQPRKWKFTEMDYAQIRSEYKCIREKAAQGRDRLDIQKEHYQFADKYPTVFQVATDVDISDDVFEMVIDMSEKAKREGKTDMDDEAKLFGKKMCDEYADPNRKKL